MERLRGGVDVRDYKNVVLSLIFLMYADFAFSKRLSEISKMKHFSGEILPEFVNDEGIYLPDDARWEYLVSQAKEEKKNLPAIVDRALRVIMETNPKLSDAFTDGFFVSLDLDSKKLSKLVLQIHEISEQKLFSDEPFYMTEDFFGLLYQLVLRKYSAKETRGKNKGEFYTPKEIVEEIVSMLGIESGEIYDPCVGTGSMLVPIVTKISRKDIRLFGQEINPETYRFAKMNFAIYNADFDIRAGDTLVSDAFSGKKFDYVLANPPFNQKTDEHKNANAAWIRHCYNKLKKGGKAAIILPGIALVDKDDEMVALRRELVSAGDVLRVINLPRNAFYGTEVFASMMILQKGAKADVVNFIDERYSIINIKDVFVSELMEQEDVSLAPSDYISHDVELSVEELDLKEEISKKIREKEMEIRKLKGMLDFSIDWSFVSGATLSEMVETVPRREAKLLPGEFGVCLIHVGRDMKMPVVYNSSDEAMKVPKNYFKFKIRKEWASRLPAEFLLLFLSQPEIANRLAFLSDKSTRGEIRKEDFLGMKIV